jgi:hypothetical protein
MKGMAGHGDPAFIAVEWDEETFKRIVEVHRPRFLELARGAWSKQPKETLRSTRP